MSFVASRNKTLELTWIVLVRKNSRTALNKVWKRSSVHPIGMGVGSGMGYLVNEKQIKKVKTGEPRYIIKDSK